MSVVVYNLNGAHPTSDFPHKPSHIHAYLNATNASFAIITETHYTNDTRLPRGAHATSKKKRKGVSILPVDPRTIITPINAKKGRFIEADVCPPGWPAVRVVAIY